MGMTKACESDIEKIAPLIAQFRVELNKLKGIHTAEQIDSARQEFLEYLQGSYPIYVWKEQGNCIGYVVCRVDEPVVWVESLFVAAGHRRKGIASALFKGAEKLAASYGEEMVYNYVHPNNDGMIAFLRHKGYDVLNLIEIRKPYTGEVIQKTIQIENHAFQY